MRRLLPAALLGLALVACDGKPPESNRQPSRPVVPPHPLREEFLGKWRFGVGARFVIEEKPGGRVTVRSPAAPSHMLIINNVRWEGDALRFDEYGYSDRRETPSVINPTGEDPTNGRLTEMTLKLTDNPDQMTWTQAYHDPAFIATEDRTLVRMEDE